MGRRIGGTLLALAALGVVGAAPAAAAGPQVEPGFPVEAWFSGGPTAGPPSGAITVGSIDADPEPEIVAAAQAGGPLYAWNADGTPVTGWPRVEVDGSVYPVLGDLSRRSHAFEVAGGGLDRIVAWDGDGTPLPGWPRRIVNFMSAGPMAADVDADGLDELYYNENTSQILGRSSDGRIFYDGLQTGNQQQATPAVADLDGDGALDIVSTDYTWVDARHADGTPVAGFPVMAGHGSNPRTWTSIGDVDGDGELEIVVLVFDYANRVRTDIAVIVGHDGAIEREIAFSGSARGAASLADLTGDGTPEIVVQADEALVAFRGDGSTVPGFPVALPGQAADRSIPVVGDVDGDLRPDIVIVTHPLGGSYDATVRAYHANGTLLDGFPIPAGNMGGPSPAIADIDLDGRNEILVAGYDDNVVHNHPFLWAYDLGGGPHGRIEWGQFGGGPQHQGRYGAPTAPPAPPAPAGAPTGARLVADVRAGAQGSRPDEVAVLGDLALFTASTAASGRELWVSDGTPGGTKLISDIRAGAAGSSPTGLVRAGDAVYFAADDGSHGRELWRTDGTADGTRMVVDMRPGQASARPIELTAIGDEVWFSATDGVLGPEPWRSDGTAAGTRMVADLFETDYRGEDTAVGSYPEDFTSAGGEVWFRAFTSQGFGSAIFRSDGTPAGTALVQGLHSGFEPYRSGALTASGTSVYFIDDENVGRTDGTTTVVTDWGTDQLATELAPIPGGVVFGARIRESSPDERALWTFRATGEPTAVGNVWSGGADMAGGMLAFAGGVGFSMDGASGSEPWATDGTRAGTRQLGDLWPGPAGSQPMMLAAIDDDVLFSADDGSHGHELWASAGSAETTRRLTDIAPGPGSANVRWVARAGDTIVLSADDGVHGQELWAITDEVREPDPTPTPTPTSSPDATTTPDPPSAPRVVRPRLSSPPTVASLSRLSLSRRVVRRGRALMVALRATGPVTVTVTIERRNRVVVSRNVRVAGHRRVRIATRRLRPAVYTVRAGSLKARVRVRR